MANPYRLAGLIWAAILVVAIQLVTNAALAHSGHHHQQAAVQQQVAAQDSEPDQAAAPVQKPEFVAASPSHAGGDASRSGVGGCCGAGLGCCCMSAALAGAAHQLPPRDAHVELVAFSVHRLGSIDPEALARPPKSLA